LIKDNAYLKHGIGKKNEQRSNHEKTYLRRDTDQCGEAKKCQATKSNIVIIIYHIYNYKQVGNINNNELK
jgi:hypothetical protein